LDGARVGPYRILREIARGGMGVVFEAAHEQTGARVALKQITVALTGEALLRFRREAELLASIDHEHVVRVRSASLSGPRPYLVQDLMPGGSLQDSLDRDGPLPWEEAVTLARKLAGALERVHALGVVHRDLKPANVLFDDRGEPRLADFGLASDGSGERERLTMTGEVLGTPSYMPPEQILAGKTVGPAADVYGLGGVLYAALTGAPPFPGEQPWKVMEAVLNREVLSPRALVGSLPAWLEAVCLRALAKQPEARFASAAELERALAEGRAPRRPGLALALLGLLTSLALAAWLAWGDRATTIQTEAPPSAQPASPAATPEVGQGLAGLAAQLAEGRRPHARELDRWTTRVLEGQVTAGALEPLPQGATRAYLLGVEALRQGDLERCEQVTSTREQSTALALLRQLLLLERERAQLPVHPFQDSPEGVPHWPILDPEQIRRFVESVARSLGTPGPVSLRSWSADRAQRSVARAFVACQYTVSLDTEQVEELLASARDLGPDGSAGRLHLRVARLFALSHLRTKKPNQRPLWDEAARVRPSELAQLPPQLRHPLHELRARRARSSEDYALELREERAALDALRTAPRALIVRHYKRVLPFAAHVVLTRLRKRWPQIQAEGLSAADEALLDDLQGLLELAADSDSGRAHAPADVRKELGLRREYSAAVILYALLRGDAELAESAWRRIDPDELHTKAVLRAELDLIRGDPQAALSALGEFLPSQVHYVAKTVRPDALTVRAHARLLAGQQPEYVLKDLGRAQELLMQQKLGEEKHPRERANAQAWLPWRTVEQTRLLVEGQGWWPGAEGD
jgi:hypothetical protein